MEQGGTCIFLSELEWSLMLPVHPLSPGCGRRWDPFSAVPFPPTHCCGKGACTQCSHGSLLWSAGLAHLTLAAAHRIAVLCHQSTWVKKLCEWGAWSWHWLGRGGREQPLSHWSGKLNFGCYFLPCETKTNSVYKRGQQRVLTLFLPGKNVLLDFLTLSWKLTFCYLIGKHTSNM